MAKYRKKPVVIDAFQWTGNRDAMRGIHRDIHPDPDDPQALLIRTMEGVMRASLGDWIIVGVNGEAYPCKPDIFEKTYERAGG